MAVDRIRRHPFWLLARLGALSRARPRIRLSGGRRSSRLDSQLFRVRFALEQEPVLAPFAESVHEHFNAWLGQKDPAAKESPLERGWRLEKPSPQRQGVSAFTAEQLAWLHLIRDHIATAISIEPEDLELSPFNQRGGLGKAHQLFGEQLPRLLDELNEVLAA